MHHEYTTIICIVLSLFFYFMYYTFLPSLPSSFLPPIHSFSSSPSLSPLRNVISCTSFTIQWSWFITVSIWCYTIIKKKTSLRSVFQLSWPPYWLPQLSGKETKMPNSKQKQHMILLSQSSQWRHWNLHSSTHCHYLLCSCLCEPPKFDSPLAKYSK